MQTLFTKCLAPDANTLGAVTFPAPHSPASDPDEREVLLNYLRWQRELVVATASGLTEDQLRWTPDGGLLPIVGIVNHLTHVEWRWIEGRYLRSPFRRAPKSSRCRRS